MLYDDFSTDEKIQIMDMALQVWSTVVNSSEQGAFSKIESHLEHYKKMIDLIADYRSEEIDK